MIQRWLTVSTVLCCVLPGRAAHAWGPVAHVAVTSRAIDALSGSLKDFYKNHRVEMPTLSPEPNFTEEGQERRFAVDRLLPFPFTDLPRTEAALKERYGDEAGKVGRLPWLIQESYGRLLTAYKSGEKDKILAESDVLGGLVADMSDPLACTDNADGQKTEQHGLWVRFTIRFPEAYQRSLHLSPEPARYLDDPKDYVFAMMRAAYIWVDNILYQEDLAHRASSGYGEIYYEALATRASSILKGQLSNAATDVGSYWYTAWTAAGRPELK